MAQLEIFDGTNWIQLASGNALNLTGAVLGSGVGTIQTLLNTTQIINNSSTFDWFWYSPNDQYMRTNLMANSLPASGGTFTEDYRSGANNSNYRMWRMIYQPGSESTPSGYCYLQYLHNQLTQPSQFLKVTAINGGFTAEINGAITMDGSHINGVGYPNVDNQAANKLYVDTVTSSLLNPINSLINLAVFGFVTKTASNTYVSRSLVAGNGITITNNNGVAGNPTISASDKSILHAVVATGYSTNLLVNDHLKFTQNRFTRGTSIILDTSTTYTSTTNVASLGRITLAAGKTYRLIAQLAVSFSATTGVFSTMWWNADTNTGLSNANTVYGSSGTSTNSVGLETILFVTPTIATRVELRIRVATSVSLIRGADDTQTVSWCIVEEV